MKRETASIRKNDRLELEITGLTAEGAGVGRPQEGGLAVFVAGTIPGERVLAHVIKTAKNYAIAKTVEILWPSPDRIQPDCPCFSQCGGCVYRHMTYERELMAKEQKVQDALCRIGGYEGFAVAPIVGANSPDRYRNKAQFPIGQNKEGEMVLGFYGFHSHRVVPCEDCLLQPESFARAAAAFREWAAHCGESVYDEATHTGKLRHFYLRQSSNGAVMACLVVNGKGVRREEELVQALRSRVPELKSLFINVNREDTNVVLGKENRLVWGEECLTDTLCGLEFTISPLSFFQVNHDQTQRLYGLAAEFAGLTGEETLLDLYCGAGTIGLSMAHQAKRLIGVEIVEPAVEDARRNAARNHIENCEFLCMDAPKAAALLEERGLRPDVVIVDPPRKGCGPGLQETIARMAPQRVVYVSCDPATLARDVKLFRELGYELQKAVPVDMFPRTSHVETCVLLGRKKSTENILYGYVDVETKDTDYLKTMKGCASYAQIKAWIEKEYGLKVSSLYVAQIKDKLGIEKRENYNKGEKKARVPHCPPEKEKAIMAAFKHFKMI